MQVEVATGAPLTWGLRQARNGGCRRSCGATGCRCWSPAGCQESDHDGGSRAWARADIGCVGCAGLGFRGGMRPAGAAPAAQPAALPGATHEGLQAPARLAHAALAARHRQGARALVQLEKTSPLLSCDAAQTLASCCSRTHRKGSALRITSHTGSCVEWSAQRVPAL